MGNDNKMIKDGIRIDTHAWVSRHIVTSTHEFLFEFLLLIFFFSYSGVEQGWCQRGTGGLQPPSGNLPLVGEKLTIRRGIFTDDNTYIVQTMNTC